MTKTRSYGDLINAADVFPNQLRRSSDPSINIDKKLTVMSQETSAQDIVNGHSKQLPSSNGGDFLCNDPDEVECNKDCIYKDENIGEKVTFNIVNGDFLSDHVINGDKTDNVVGDECEDDVRSVCLQEYLTPSNHNHDVDSDNELTEKSESKSENTVCDLGAVDKLETSTDTLVSDNHNIR